MRTANLWLATLLPFFIAVAVGVPLVTGDGGSTATRVTRIIVVVACLTGSALAARALARGTRR